MTAGILVAFWINYALQDFENGWRYALAGQAVPAVVLLLSCLWLPQSPRWLAQQGMLDEARLTLVMLRVGKTMAEIEEELDAIEDSIRSGAHTDTWGSLWTDGGARRRLLIGMAIQSGQNLTGINAIMYYAPSIFTSCGFGSANLLAQGINGVVNFVATLWAFKVVDQKGRRQLLLLGGVIMGGSMALLGGLGFGFSHRDPDDSSGVVVSSKLVGYVCILLVFVFVVGFAISWGPVCWLLPTEMFPVTQRARCVSLTTGANFFWNIAVGLFTPVALDSIHWGVMLIFAGLSACNFLFVYFFLPETKGVPLEQVPQMFEPNHTKPEKVLHETITDSGITTWSSAY
eukprot:TRINITY_DN54935_c0_g1_i1.p1 TRINITY_DN54935_c0_g1~~TRINITY_DN54935_c0_g1_i1.p1  ORF type:complete len:344 (+),score=61.89 TRINITY_DN54935_c0_g1_i1:199-1230(+)